MKKTASDSDDRCYHPAESLYPSSGELAKVAAGTLELTGRWLGF